MDRTWSPPSARDGLCIFMQARVPLWRLRSFRQHGLLQHWSFGLVRQLCQGPARLTQQPRGGGIPHRPGPYPNPPVGLSRG